MFSIEKTTKDSLAFTIRDLNERLYVIESRLESDDIGKDLTAVLVLLEQHQVKKFPFQSTMSHFLLTQSKYQSFYIFKIIEDELKLLEDHMSILNQQGTLGKGPTQPSTEPITSQIAKVEERFNQVRQIASQRDLELKEAKKLYEFYESVAREESWLKEKCLLFDDSDNFGKDHENVINLRNKLKRIAFELDHHLQVINVWTKKQVFIVK